MLVLCARTQQILYIVPAGCLNRMRGTLCLSALNCRIREIGLRACFKHLKEML